MFDRRLVPPRTFYHFPDVAACGPFEGQIRYPFVNSRESVEWLACLERNVEGVHLTSHAGQSIGLQLPLEAEAADYPLEFIAPVLRQSDIVFGNLECPLSLNGRRHSNDASYAAQPVFASAMARAGFQVVSFANNHCFDRGEAGFLDTLDVLAESGIAVTGAGRSLDAARAAALFSVNGVSVGFLAYSLVGPDWIYATADESGVAPLNPLVAGQDIARIRDQVDMVVVSVHWGVEGRSAPWLRQIELAHLLVDSGADILVGHHSHVPGSVEVYRGRPIVYSLGNFIFGHDHSTWGDNMIVRFHVEGKRCRKVEILPIRGRYQPAVLSDSAAIGFHTQMNDISRMFSTVFRYSAPVSVLDLVD